jgi:hypothetical protein
VAVLAFPARSVTVTVTVYVPAAEYVWGTVAPDCGPTTGEPSPKLNEYEEIGEDPAADPDASADTCNGATPELGVTASFAVGGAATVTCWVAMLVSPAVSVTVTVTVYVPAAEYVCEAVAPDCGPTTADPSPKSNLYEAIGSEAAVEADASTDTCNGAMPELGVTLRLAVGGISLTVTCCVVVLLTPAESVTVIATVYVPGKVYVCGAVAPGCAPTAGEPSPKLN